jgi:hypothetical protein
MPDIEFPNWANTFVQSAQAGGQIAQQRRRQNALASYATDPAGAENALMAAGDVETANALAQRRMGQQRMEAEQAHLQRRQAVGAQAAKGDLTGARTAALAAGDLDLAGEISKLDDQAKAKLEQNNAKVGGIAYQLLQEKDPGVRQQLAAAAIPHLVEQGVLSQEQAQKVDLSDAGLQGYVSQAMQLKDIIAQANTDRSYGLEVDKFGHQKETDSARIGLDRQRVGYEGQRVGMEGARLGLERQRVGLEAQRVAQTANGGLTPAQTRKAEADLRKEFDGRPEVKNFRTVESARNTVKALASAAPTAQNDIALIYSVMKTYDPTSVVRETEFATAQNAAGVPDKIRNAYNKALNGQRLNQKQRAEMSGSVETVYRSQAQRFKDIEGQYRGYAKDYGASPDRVAPQAAANVIRYDAQGNRIK